MACFGKDRERQDFAVVEPRRLELERRRHSVSQSFVMEANWYTGGFESVEIAINRPSAHLAMFGEIARVGVTLVLEQHQNLDQST